MYPRFTWLFVSERSSHSVRSHASEVPWFACLQGNNATNAGAGVYLATIAGSVQVDSCQFTENNATRVRARGTLHG